MATLEYEGYIARIETDEENNGFHGRVINIGDIVNFKGRSMAELKREFANSMKEYFASVRREVRTLNSRSPGDSSCVWTRQFIER